MLPSRKVSFLRCGVGGLGVAMAALMSGLPAQALDLPGAVPGSMVHIDVPRREVAEAPAPAAPVAVATELAPVVPGPLPVVSAAVVPAAVVPAPPAPEVKAASVAEPVAKPSDVKPADTKIEVPVVAAAGPVDEAKIRAYLEPRRIKYRLKPEEVAGFVATYAARGGKAYFIDEQGGDARLSPKVEAIAATLAKAGNDGLDAARLKAELPVAPAGALASERRVEAELASAFAAFLYARDARGGRLEPARLSALTTPTLYLPAPADVLGALDAASVAGVAGVLEGYQPRHEGYKRLKAELARLDEPTTPVITANVATAPGGPTPQPALPANFMEGGPLRLGQADDRVPNLRIRLNMPASASNVFDAEVRAALIAFQKGNGLTANGWLTPRTRAALENHSAPVDASPAQSDKRALRSELLVNMERWRWLPPELGNRHVFVNIPAFQLKLMEGSTVVHEARVIVGKPQTQTPVFSDQFAHVIVNPSWFVPPSIIKKEFLPKLAADPSYAAKRGFEVVQTRHGLSVRQPPGERNALGHIKFIFPNRHSVYLHDTPSRGLFVNDMRAFSHGCVRVDKPFALAEKLLSQSGGFSEGQLRSMVGRGERMIKMGDAVGVHLSYFTLMVDESGTLRHYRDLYGHDARVKSALAL